MYVYKRKKKKKGPKIAKDLQAHAKERCAERYGITLTKKEITNIDEQIRNNSCKLIKKLSLNRSIWRVTLPNKKRAYAIYDKRRKTIVTFLTHEMVQRNRTKK